MQDISSIFFSGIIETSDVFIAGVCSIPRRVNLYVRTPFDRLKANGLLNFAGLPGRSNRSFALSPAASLVSRHEVAIMYSGHARVSLMMTSERMVIPTGRYTLGQLLCSLYKRGDRWADELDDSHLVCTVNGREAMLYDPIAPGAEIRISS